MSICFSISCHVINSCIDLLQCQPSSHVSAVRDTELEILWSIVIKIKGYISDIPYIKEKERLKDE